MFPTDSPDIARDYGTKKASHVDHHVENAKGPATVMLVGTAGYSANNQWLEDCRAEGDQHVNEEKRPELMHLS